jgi:hypothetical protein
MLVSTKLAPIAVCSNLRVAACVRGFGILDIDEFVAIYRNHGAETLRSFKGRNAQFEHK